MCASVARMHAHQQMQTQHRSISLTHKSYERLNLNIGYAKWDKSLHSSFRHAPLFRASFYVRQYLWKLEWGDPFNWKWEFFLRNYSFFITMQKQRIRSSIDKMIWDEIAARSNEYRTHKWITMTSIIWLVVRTMHAHEEVEKWQNNHEDLFNRIVLLPRTLYSQWWWMTNNIQTNNTFHDSSKSWALSFNLPGSRCKTIQWKINANNNSSTMVRFIFTP